MPNTRHPDPIVQLDLLYRIGMRVLTREMRALNLVSIKDKLSHAQAQDLRDYLKLLKDWRDGMEKVAASKAAKVEASRKAKTDEELIASINNSTKA